MPLAALTVSLVTLESFHAASNNETLPSLSLVRKLHKNVGPNVRLPFLKLSCVIISDTKSDVLSFKPQRDNTRLQEMLAKGS